MIKRDFRRRRHISAAELQRRRGVLLRTRLRRCGSGDWDSLYTGIGPSRGLIGQPVAGQPRVAATKLQAGIANAVAMRTVRRNSLVRPTQIAGSIVGGGPRDTRAIAVAVNGTIEATGVSFHLRLPRAQRARSGESFAVMVPERSIRPGRNRVEVFEIVGGRKLRPLGDV